MALYNKELTATLEEIRPDGMQKWTVAEAETHLQIHWLTPHESVKGAVIGDKAILAYRPFIGNSRTWQVKKKIS